MVFKRAPGLIPAPAATKVACMKRGSGRWPCVPLRPPASTTGSPETESPKLNPGRVVRINCGISEFSLGSGRPSLVNSAGSRMLSTPSSCFRDRDDLGRARLGFVVEEIQEGRASRWHGPRLPAGHAAVGVGLDQAEPFEDDVRLNEFVIAGESRDPRRQTVPSCRRTRGWLSVFQICLMQRSSKAAAWYAANVCGPKRCCTPSVETRWTRSRLTSFFSSRKQATCA